MAVLKRKSAMDGLSTPRKKTKVLDQTPVRLTVKQAPARNPTHNDDDSDSISDDLESEDFDGVSEEELNSTAPKGLSHPQKASSKSSRQSNGAITGAPKVHTEDHKATVLNGEQQTHRYKLSALTRTRHHIPRSTCKAEGFSTRA